MPLLFFTPLTAVILTPLYIGLTVQVIRNRIRLRVSVGDGSVQLISNLQRGNEKPEINEAKYEPLRGAIRAHANFSENVPLSLFLIFLSENQKALPSWALGLVSLALVIARSAHYITLTAIKNHGAGHWSRTFAVASQIAIYWTLTGSLALSLITSYL